MRQRAQEQSKDAGVKKKKKKMTREKISMREASKKQKRVKKGGYRGRVKRRVRKIKDNLRVLETEIMARIV